MKIKKAVRMTLYTFSGFFTIALVTVVCLPFIMNPNDFKHEIEDTVQELTGRTLSIEGDIKLSFFPWLGLSIQKITLGNAKDFQAPYFAQIKQSQLKIRVIPLLSRKLEVSEIIIKGLQLNLAKNTQGKTNWADLEVLSTGGNAEIETPLLAFKMAGFLLDDAHIVWDDPQNNHHITLSHLNLSMGQWGFDQKIPLKVSLKLANQTPQLNQVLNFSSDFFINKRFDNVQLQNTTFSLETKSPLIGTEPLIVQFFSHLQFDKPKHLLIFKALKISSGRLIFNALKIN
ncbi:MAG: AsmA family protein, partial [Methylococcales bacterium]|nr:AsmA family protein [Methylococcales bacterium]